MTSSPKIVVVGSVNMDLVIRCARLPVPGQTIIAESSSEIPGGKGANQAVAAARAGGDVTMIGRVGDDSMADRLLDNLRRQQIQTELIRQSGNCASGLAVVAVESSGENAIMVVPGANGQVSVSDVEDAEAVLQEADLVLLQLEIPIATVIRTIEIAKRAGVTVVLDPAPMPASLPRQALGVDVVCPNQSEAAALVGHPVESIDDAKKAATTLTDLGAGRVIITLAEQGALIHDGSTCQWIKPFRITAVDTTAAGDAFAGALAVRLAEGCTFVQAAQFATAAGALAATQLGAQPAMPTRDQIEQMIRSSEL